MKAIITQPKEQVYETYSLLLGTPKEIYLFNALGMLDYRCYPEDWIYERLGPDGMTAFIFWGHERYGSYDTTFMFERYVELDERWLFDLAKDPEGRKPTVTWQSYNRSGVLYESYDGNVHQFAAPQGGKPGTEAHSTGLLPHPKPEKEGCQKHHRLPGCRRAVWRLSRNGATGMIGTDENRAALHVEVIFWSGKRKIPPSLVSGKYCPHFVVIGTTEYLGVCFLDGTECTFDTPALGNAQPLYPDTIDYAPLENNAEFLNL